ncbi:phosphoribosylformylglycinamidine cyclo-ligase [Halarchaeum rubridurum]|uniref:Phosphoribosylformylglycinamidine cyclo-ligase n=1 Tax=Halarchaeum rubridurum TaxID=489911 RepID=A0A830FV65_9EURY|nr:phosphoribosylformylglycinamidine cyclo-ligase [Halarchaeum rubridurum]MBP1953361.1 phosphoribosylformylglycinamidine cyclo-ligase [Halarchaeum rubridurum]GGM65881.1 phosphoribosylformylglycinamidine cyclo-ligase [Halarchaeum rubridurum]
MSEDADTESDEGMTYAEAGVDIDASEAATAALVDAVADVGNTTDYAGLVPVGDQYLALATDGVGTKLLVAEAVGDYSTVGIDCIAMNVNDLVAAGVAPDAFVDYLAVDEPSEALTSQVGEGLAAGAEEAGMALVGGETAVMPEVVNGFDLAGTVAGLATEDDLFPGEAEAGDALVGFASTGIHSNGLTLARKAATDGDGEYGDDYPYEGYETVGEALLEPTRLYTYLLPHLRERDVHAAAHVTGGGWTNLSRMGEHEYDVTDPLPAQDVFAFVQERGSVSDEEMHRTFNMGTGFVVALPEAEAEKLVVETDGERIGTVREGDSVEVRGLSL